MNSKNKTRLELTWIGKDQRPRLEPRILLEDTEKTYHAEHRVSESDQFDNRLIFGEKIHLSQTLLPKWPSNLRAI